MQRVKIVFTAVENATFDPTFHVEVHTFQVFIVDSKTIHHQRLTFVCCCCRKRHGYNFILLPGFNILDALNRKC